MNEELIKPKNIPAFPVPLDSYSGAEGMTLLDYFAAKFGAAISGHEAGTMALQRQADEEDKPVSQVLAEVSYCIADYFLAERAKRGIQ